MKNELINCMCNCGKMLEKYDQKGRERKFILGHNGVLNKGKTTCNRGRTYEEILGSKEKAEERKNKQRNVMSGKHHTEETKRKIKEKHIINLNYGMKNKHHSEKSKQKSSLSNKKYWAAHPRIGDLNPFFGKQHTEHSKELNRQATIRRLSEGKFPHTNTLPHRLLKEAMQRNNLWEGFKDEVPFRWGSIDIGNENKKLAIYVDGDYWHNLPDSKRKDSSHNTYLKNQEWKVLRLWEHEIKNNIDECITKIKTFCHCEDCHNMWRTS